MPNPTEEHLSLTKHLALLADILEPHHLEKIIHCLREEQEEVRDLFRAACSSVNTARWVLGWLEAETRLRSLAGALWGHLGTDPNG
jgi:hypothetical protein